MFTLFLIALHGPSSYHSANQELYPPARVQHPSYILLSHNPDVFPLAARMGFDLTVSGHTHGGQVRTEILHQDVDLARVYTPFVAGLYRSGGRSCYVTRGIGSIGMPTRLGAPPEITVLRLTRAEST